MSTILVDGATITVLPPTVFAMTVHSADACAGRTCIVHAPTEHSLRSWPLIWRDDRGIFERRCEHGIGHPDPDQRAFWRSCAEADLIAGGEPFTGENVTAMASAMSVHGCDGCCAGATS